MLLLAVLAVPSLAGCLSTTNGAPVINPYPPPASASTIDPSVYALPTTGPDDDIALDYNLDLTPVTYPEGYRRFAELGHLPTTYILDQLGNVGRPLTARDFTSHRLGILIEQSLLTATCTQQPIQLAGGGSYVIPSGTPGDARNRYFPYASSKASFARPPVVTSVTVDSQAAFSVHVILDPISSHNVHTEDGPGDDQLNQLQPHVSGQSMSATLTIAADSGALLAITTVYHL